MNRASISLIAIIAAVWPTTSSSQTSGSLFRSGSKQMAAICSSEQNMSAVAANALGYSASRTARDAETRAVDEFALAAARTVKFQTQSSTWRPEPGEQGRCHLSLILTLTPAVAANFGGKTVLSADVQLRLRRTGNGWTLQSEYGDSGIPVSGFRDYFRPFAYANAKRRIADANRTKFETQQEAAAARRQAAEEAEAAFKRDHPREWAAEQEQLRLEKERRRKETLAQEAEERRKAAACEANGGTWGYKRHPYSGIRTSEIGCFFRTSE